MAGKTCDWRIWPNFYESCGAPAVAHVTWPDDKTFYYCAEHYDQRIELLRTFKRFDVLKASGVSR